ncbi:MAG: hypothetical protein EOO68_09510 [Moraxellaceae bacterium]|nr:MAG: hypothetical protein EOO68_09510 [Moraxellaceae bacterium]
MKSVLVIISQGSLAGQSVLEALSATMVLATYGLAVKVCLINDAVSLLNPPRRPVNTTQSTAFKSAYHMIESFEFYDLLPLWIELTPHQAEPVLSNTIDYQSVKLDAALLAQFDQVLYW